MRGTEHIGQIEEGVIGPEWGFSGRLIPPGVYSGAELRVRAQVLVQCALIDNRGSGHVHHDGGWLHQGELAPAEQPAGGQGQRQRDDEHIRHREYPVQVRQGAHELGGFAGPAVAADGVDAGAERLHQPRCGGADPAQAKDGADRAIQDERRLPFVELAGRERSMPLRQPLGEAVGAGVAGHYQPVRHRREVDRVDTGREQLDETEPRGILKGACRNLFGQLPGEQCLGTPQSLRALCVIKLIGADDLGITSQDLGVDPGKVLICRIAHRYQPFVAHRPSFPSHDGTPAGAH